MIRVYDVIAALFFAWIILNMMFLPYIGLILAWITLSSWDVYCVWRLTVEE